MKFLFDYKFYLAVFLLIGKSPLSRFGLPIERLYSGMILVFFIMLIVYFAKADKVLLVNKEPFIFLITVLFMLFFVSIFYSKNIEYAFNNYFVPNIFIYFTIIFFYLSFKSLGDIKQLLLYLYYVSIVLLLLGLLALLSQGGRVSVLGGGPNTFYRLMIQCYLLAFFYYHNSKIKPKKLFHLTVMGLSILLIMNTGSKGGIITLAIIFFIQFINFLLDKGENAYRKIVTILGSYLFIHFSLINFIDFLIIKFPTVKRIWAVFSLNELMSSTSGAARINLIKQSINMFLDKPLFGWGPGGVFYYTNLHSSAQPYSHNIFFEMLSEYGLVGLFLFFCISLLVLIRIIKNHQLINHINIKEFKNGLITIELLLLNFFIGAQFSGNIIDSRTVFFYMAVISKIYLIFRRELIKKYQ